MQPHFHEFSDREYDRRKARLLELMSERGLEAIVLSGDWSGATNYRYVSGHSPRDYQMSYSRPHIFVMNARGEAAIAAIYFSAGQVVETSWVENVVSYSQPFTVDILTQLFGDLGIHRGKVGWELGVGSRMALPFATFLEFGTRLPQVEAVDFSSELFEMRKVKSAEEIEKIRMASEINHRALSNAFTSEYEELTERNIYREVVRQIITEHPSPRPPFAQILSMSSNAFSGPLGAKSQFLPASEEALRTGDTIVVDSGTAVDGYWSEFARMGVVGGPSRSQAERHSVLRELVSTMLEDSYRPGDTAEQIIDSLVKTYARLGFEPGDYQNYLTPPYRHLSHGLGLEASEEPLLMRGANEVLAPGMVISIEVAIQGEGVRYCTEETITITDTGAEVLSPRDIGMFSIPEKG
jgi:Xaa-Pro aminopeptidase